MKLPKEGITPQEEPEMRAGRSKSREPNLSELKIVILIQTIIFIATVALMISI
jgi:hypothetical protein